MKEIKSSSLLARADKGAEDTVRGQRRSEQVAFKPFIQQIGDAHRQDAQELVHFLFAEAMKLPTYL